MSDTRAVPRSSDNKVAKLVENATKGSDENFGILGMISRYEKLQRCLDKALPDCMVTIPTKHGQTMYRTKKYWNAVALAFKIEVTLVSEERIRHETESETHWGYMVIYRARINYASQIGDGACTSDEITSPTLHTVRSRAHTRARNRAISNLVAFGEVTAEELSREY